MKAIKLGSVGTVFGALIAMTVWTVPASAGNGACTTNKSDYRTNTNIVTTESEDFSNIPKTNVSFTQGGSGDGCVVVSYSASGQAFLNDSFSIRVVMDKKHIAEPGEVLFEGETGNISRGHTFKFVLPNVSPGPHKIWVQWRSNIGGEVYMFERTTVVDHR